jgi:hypothetical protein
MRGRPKLIDFESFSDQRADARQARPSGVESEDRDQPGPHIKGAAKMTDKSPRQSMGKKSQKSLKEKRADKRAKSDGTSQADAVFNPKKR